MDVIEEVDTLDQLHGEEPVQAITCQLVEGDEVGVVQPGQTAELLLEAQ